MDIRLLAIATTVIFSFLNTACLGAEKIKILLIDGQNNHDWKKTTPLLVELLEEVDLYEVTVSTAPKKAAKGEKASPEDPKWSSWNPNFSSYDVVVSNYNGELWPKRIQTAFEEFVSEGGGFVVIHAADNAFPHWESYNEMIGVGGWGGRQLKENGNVWVYVENGNVIRDNETEGQGGRHDPKAEFVVEHVDVEHPITLGLPSKWLHTRDELYCSMCGPAKNLDVLATARSNKTKKNEPMFMTIRYGEGRVFHTTLGHDDISINCRGFYELVQRGTEWVARGEVKHTASVPEDFPVEGQVSVVEK